MPDIIQAPPGSRNVVGAPLRRREDPRLLRGRGRFLDDHLAPRMVHAAFVRSEIAHGELRSIDATAARLVRGVIAVLTAEDLAHRLRPLIATCVIPGYQPTEIPALAGEKVRYVGEPLAIVLASSRYVAEDAADEVRVVIDPLPAITNAEQALAPEAPQLHEAVAGNVYFEDAFTTDGFADHAAAAPNHLTLDLRHARASALPMETRGILAEPDSDENRLTATIATQVPHFMRVGLSAALNLPESQIRIIARDVGGGFGAKLALYAEYMAVCAAALQTGRPVKWAGDRREELLTASHAREQRHIATAGYDDDGRLLTLDVDMTADSGAYGQWPHTALLEVADSAETFVTVYDVQNLSIAMRAHASNKAHTGPYRGVGRVMTAFTVERVMDAIARELDLDPLEVRSRNIVRHFPYVTAAELNLESASFAESIDVMKDRLPYPAWREQQRSARQAGRHLGIGFAFAIEPSAPGIKAMSGLGAPVMIGYETANVTVAPDGSVRVTVGSHSHGQGHETTMAQIAADALSISMDRVVVAFGDTDALATGGGTWASRSAVHGGAAIMRACQGILERARGIAASILDVDEAVITYHEGRFAEAGQGGRTLTLADLARRASFDAASLDTSTPASLDLTVSAEGHPGTVSSRLHACIVEVDPEIGSVQILRYLAVEDSGRQINPMIVEGQIRGGIAQGIGQALLEQLPFGESGQPLATTLVDYMVPTADVVPDIEIVHLMTPSSSMTHGIKGMAEGGVIPPPAALAAAIEDALEPWSVRIDRVPILPDVMAVKDLGVPAPAVSS